MFCSLFLLLLGVYTTSGFIPFQHQKCFSRHNVIRAAARVLHDVGNKNDTSPEKRKYSISQPHYVVRRVSFQSPNEPEKNDTDAPIDIRNMTRYILPRSYPISRSHHENYLRRLNSRNITIQGLQILNGADFEFNEGDIQDLSDHPFFKHLMNNSEPGFRITGIQRIGNVEDFQSFNNGSGDDDDEGNAGDHEDDFAENMRRNIFGAFRAGGGSRGKKGKKSDNYEVLTDFHLNFSDVGGYDKIKKELYQCVDILSNYTKYARFNVRIPRGLVLEGPPGNGKTLLAKAFAGEAGVGFIPVSGSEFQEKYVGVGSARIRELFELASENTPCIVFIDEMDAVGRKRSGDGESSTSERDSTLNELLVALDGFKNNTGIFVIGATNRVDLLDPALMRPGRIDKQIFISNPDDATREAILNIHLRGKPYDEKNINVDGLVDMTQGMSGAQIENLLNEGMLHALRENREVMNMTDVDITVNKMMAGWQATDHQFTSDIVDHIAIHEMGHAIVGILSQHHSKMTKVVINLSSPRTPGYTVFEASTSNIHTREALFEHLAILLAGRIAEEVCYDVSVTTGAINDFEEAFKLAERMILYYGMGKSVIYPSSSEKYKEMIDNEVAELIDSAYAYSVYILQQCKEALIESADILKRDKLLQCSDLETLLQNKYPDIKKLK